jgi:hypothetical protein
MTQLGKVNIEVALDHKGAVNKAHVEFSQRCGGIQTLIEGPPVFSGAVATGCTMIVSEGFADYLKTKRIPFRLTG